MASKGSLLADSGSSGGATETPAGGLASFFEGLKSNFGQSSQSASDQGVDQASAPAPQGGEGTPQAISTELEGNPSPPPSLTAGIEAETDQNSDKPAVQALIEGVSLRSLPTADRDFSTCGSLHPFLLVVICLLGIFHAGGCHWSSGSLSH